MGLGAEAPPSLTRRTARVAPAILAAVLIAACTKPPPATEAATGEDLAFPTRPSLRIATRDVESIDPIEIETLDEIVVADQVFDGLVSYDPETTEIVPSAAKSWEVSDGGRRFVFHLRGGAEFHDGSSVDAEDFAFAWNRLADPVVAAPFSFLLEGVAGYDSYQSDVRVHELDGVRALDANSLEVRLARPWRDFVSVLGHPALSPVPSGQGGGLQASVRVIGNGPYRVAGTITRQDEFHLERFDEHLGPPSPVRRLVFRPFADADEAWPEFLAGDLDVAPIPASLLADAEGRYGASGIRPLTRLLYCGFRRDDPRFRDRSLRRAVSFALDRQQIATGVYGGLAVPATGIVPPGVPGHDVAACGPLCQQRLERARALVSELPRRDRAFALDFTESPVGGRLARAIDDQLEAVGFEVNPRPHEPREYTAILEEGTQEMFCLVWVGDYPRQQAMLEPLLLSSSPDNHAGWRLPELDRLLSQARGAATPDERIELYRRAESLALSAMPLVPLVWFRSHLAAKPYVEGFRVSPLGTFDASSLRIATGG